jgi:biopolymer transport protein ExbB
MYPLLISSIALITIIVERAITLRRASVDGDLLLERIKEAYNGDPRGKSPEAAIAICQRVQAPLARIFIRGLKNAQRDADAIEMAMEQEAANEQPVLEAYLPILKTIVNIAPLLGLVGTIMGMMSSFQVASQAGLSNPTAILGGISEALVSTATGISLAIVGFITYNYFANLARKATDDIEYYGAELVNFLTGRFD